jgi:predicted permease
MGNFCSKFMAMIVELMNPPLWAMLCAIVIACVPKLRELFFTKGTFLNTSVTRAIEQSGGVAVPLILVVLGANLARNTIPTDQLNTEDPKTQRKLLIACLISRLVLPLAIMGPMLALLAKFAPVSIVDDPVFVVVCFLLTGAPSALQLAQICQLNNVYVAVMSKLLFLSYVVS